jgi:phage tail-like protein
VTPPQPSTETIHHTTRLRRRFTTTRIGPRVADGSPKTASLRAYLRDGLPAIYRDPDTGGLGQRFVGGLEEVLDPIIAVLDSLPAHFSADLAPRDILELLGAWLGIDLDESWPEERRRELVKRAGELGRRRGTKGGLELALGIAFPHLPLRVEDGGGVAYGKTPADLPKPNPPGFIVYCDEPLSEAELVSVARMIEQIKPIQVSYRLRVRTRPKGQGANGA